MQVLILWCITTKVLAYVQSLTAAPEYFDKSCDRWSNTSLAPESVALLWLPYTWVEVLVSEHKKVPLL